MAKKSTGTSKTASKKASSKKTSKKTSAKSKSAAAKQADKKTSAKAAQTAKSKKSTESQVPISRNMRVWLIWLVIIAVIAGISWLSHRSPTEQDTSEAKTASDEIIQDFQAGECSDVYAATTEDFKSRSSEDNWNNQCTIASDILQGAPEEVETQNDNFEDEAVQFVYRIQGTDDQSYILATVMVRNENQWLMDGLSSQVEETPQAPEGI